MDSKGILRIGTSGMVLPGPKKSFHLPYQSGSRLHYYSALFNTLEVNSTFYKLPLKTTLEKWAADVPDDFRFTVKLWKEITHRKKLSFESEHIHTFMEIAAGIGQKKGCLLVQFPASIKADSFGSVKNILTQVIEQNTTPAWQLCVEFRDMSWYDNVAVKSLLERLNIGIVQHDMPKSTPPALSTMGKVLYLRFHGPEGDYKGGYSEKFLQHQAESIETSLAQGKDVYVYFNNTIGDALKNAQRLQKLTEA